MLSDGLTVRQYSDGLFEISATEGVFKTEIWGDESMASASNVENDKNLGGQPVLASPPLQILGGFVPPRPAVIYAHV
jgi:hypothetical protein